MRNKIAWIALVVALVAGEDFLAARDLCSLAKADHHLVGSYAKCIAASMASPFEDR